MITVTTVQLNAWLALFIWPFARILALIATAPVLGNEQFSATTKIGLAALITLLIAPSLPIPNGIDPGSGSGLLLLAREILLGVAMGIAMRVIFAAIEMAGDLVGLQMGLGFAQFFDINSNAHTPVVGQFLGLLASLVFLAVNAHLLLISTVVESFHTVPVGTATDYVSGSMMLVQWGGMIMQTAVLLSLPLVAILLITNAALAVLTRAAPQLNIFAIGFPITILVGFLALLLVLPSMLPVMERSFDQGLAMMLQLVR